LCRVKSLRGSGLNQNKGFLVAEGFSKCLLFMDEKLCTIHPKPVI